MSEATPTPPAKTASNNVSTPKTPGTTGIIVNPNAERVTREARLNEYVKRIRAAIASIDLVSHTATRSILGGYYRHINPDLARFGQQEFPKTVRRHARSNERSTEYSKPALLFFHIGNAILGLYSYTLGHANATSVLEARVKLIEDIASQGLGKFRMDGDENQGFVLEQGS